MDDACTLGALCTPTVANAKGGCGTTAASACSAVVQLPSGKPYVETYSYTNQQNWTTMTNTNTYTETKLNEGEYAVCVCLGTTRTGTGVQIPTASAGTTYGPANGNGGCDTQNEFTLVASSVASNPPGTYLRVISEPQLGRYADTGGQVTLRQVAAKSATYHIKAQSTTAGYQVANGDKIYFAPSATGCGQFT